MKKTNKRRQSSKSLIVLIVLTAILMISSSYAWFTSNQTVTVDPIQVQVNATNGLQISHNAFDWSAKVTAAQLKTASENGYDAAKNFIPAVMLPASSPIREIPTGTGRMEMYAGNVDTDEDTGEYFLSSTLLADETQMVQRDPSDPDSTEGYYIVFDVFLKLDLPSKVYLKSSSNVTYAGDRSRGLENAARVAFMNLGNVTADQPSDAQSLATNSGITLWEPNYDVHTATGAQNAISVYGVTGLGLTGQSRVPYRAVNKAFSNINIKQTDAAHDTAANFIDVTPDIATAKPTATPAANVAFPCLNNYDDPGDGSTELVMKSGITKLRVYMWIEGQDVDCENNASGTSISYTFDITKLAS
jgi:hypothetical protein